MIVNSIIPDRGRDSSKESDVNINIKITRDPAFDLIPNPHHKLIILLTSFRGGSTFLGNVFDINPKLQYLYEPFSGGHIQNMYEKGWINGARVDHTPSDLKMLYIQQILHNCSVHGTPFPERHEFCGTPEENLHRLNSTTCNTKNWINGAGHQEICRYRNVTVMKVIRLPVLSDILKISQIRSANIYIIHLLRHPSPVLMSRRTGGMFYTWQHASHKSVEVGDDSERRVRIAWEAFNYGKDNLVSSEFATSQPWLRGRYFQVTHRDMSLQPLETAQRIYDFVNETLTDEVRDYVVSITDGSHVAAGAQTVNKSNNVVRIKKDALEVRKNSSEVVDAWKRFYTRVYYWDVISIEAQCRSLFRLIGDDQFTVDRMSLSKLKTLYFAKLN